MVKLDFVNEDVQKVVKTFIKFHHPIKSYNILCRLNSTNFSKTVNDIIIYQKIHNCDLLECIKALNLKLKDKP